MQLARSRLRIRPPLAAVADERGAVALEAAIAIPFLLTLGFGVIEFANLLYNYNLVQSGLRDAARYLARVDTPAAAETAARRLAVTGRIAAGGKPRVAWWKAEDISIAYESVANPTDASTGLKNYRGGASITVVRVATTVDYADLGLLAFLRLGPVRFSLAHEERFIGD